MGENRGLQHDLNADAHRLAISFVPEEYGTLHDLSAPSAQLSLHLGHLLMSKWLAKIQEEVHPQSVQETICKNVSWSPIQFNMVDWGALKHSLSNAHRSQRLSYCKLLHGLLNTNI
jgi:hypothetical protein